VRMLIIYKCPEPSELHMYIDIVISNSCQVILGGGRPVLVCFHMIFTLGRDADHLEVVMSRLGLKALSQPEPALER